MDLTEYGLGAQPHFDDRSRNYGIAEVIPDRRSIVHTTKMWDVPDKDVPLDQGREGACTGFSLSTELAASPVNVDVNNAFALELYQAARRIDAAAGRHWGSGASILATALALKNDYKLITEFRWAFGIEQVIDTIISKGPVVLGLNWYFDMYSPNAENVIEVSGELTGRHAIAAIGYLHEDGGYLALMNTWGPGYGAKGIGYLKIADATRLLAEDGEACIITDLAIRPQVTNSVFATESGNKFHRPAAHNWLKTPRTFDSRDAAVVAGLRPCWMCKP